MRKPYIAPQEDELWSLSQAAKVLGFNIERSRRRIRESGITPVRTPDGIRYLSSDIIAIGAQIRNRRI